MSSNLTSLGEINCSLLPASGHLILLPTPSIFIIRYFPSCPNDSVPQMDAAKPSHREKRREGSQFLTDQFPLWENEDFKLSIYEYHHGTTSGADFCF